MVRRNAGMAMKEPEPNPPKAKDAIPPGAGPVKPDGEAPGDASKLTPEEQMERFAKELKENDWGHQPC